MVPSTRLLWLVAAIAFPAAVFGALAPGWELVAWWIGMACVAMALLDATLGRVSLNGISTLQTDVAHLYKDRPATILTKIDNQSGKPRHVRMALDLPLSFEAKYEELRVELPQGAGSIEWAITPHRRGRYLLDACYLETRSPLGLFDVRRKLPMTTELRVYPNLRTPEGLLALRKGLAGVHAQRQVGQGREFEKLREYSAGDAYDQILTWLETCGIRAAEPVNFRRPAP